MVNIVNVGYDSTHYYALEGSRGILLVDCGWPGTLPKMLAQLKRKGVDPGRIRCLMVTHFHPDHAGIVQEIKNLGPTFIMLESQPAFIKPMEEIFARRKLAYSAIQPEGTRILKFGGSRAFLGELGIDGEIIATPGHSEDSVTLILDDGSAFSGDLQPRFAVADDDAVSRASWERICEHKISRLYPAHGQ
ncbi:MAG: MBL fold metallo-hydrolase [Bacteroidota bacterium]